MSVARTNLSDRCSADCSSLTNDEEPKRDAYPHTKRVHKRGALSLFMSTFPRGCISTDYFLTNLFNKGNFSEASIHDRFKNVTVKWLQKHKNSRHLLVHKALEVWYSTLRQIQIVPIRDIL